MIHHMGIFSFRRQQAPAPVPDPPKREEGIITADAVAFSRVDERVPKPTAKESRGGWVEYGDDNRYPDFLLSLLDSCSLHGGIVTGKAFLTAGGKVLVDGRPWREWAALQPPAEAASATRFFENSGLPWEDLKSMLAFDWEVSSSFALEVIWRRDFSGIAKVNHLPWQNLRPSPMDDEGRVNSYWWSDKWKKNGGDEPVEMQAFSEAAMVPGGLSGDALEAHTEAWSHRQVLYVKNFAPGYEYFGRPVYAGAIGDVQTAAALRNWSLGAAEDGFAPSVLVQYNEYPKSKEEATQIARDLERQFSFRDRARKIAVLFAKSKDVAPSITPLSVKNVDDTITTLAEQTNAAIVTGHAVTSPELVGVTVPGQLGSGDVDVKWRVFSSTVIDPSRAVIERTVSRLARLSGVPAVTFRPIDPFKEDPQV